MKLTASLVKSFAGVYISPQYDDACAIPAFHVKAWELYCSERKQCMVIAPRDHAKSTALTITYTLASVLFRDSDYVVLVGSTEENAAELVGNITEHLVDNEAIIEEFGPFKFITEAKSEIVVECKDGHKFRILARGAEQRIRGKLWHGKRPDLLICDDMEDDEQVQNKDRRIKFRKWFFRAAKQAVSKSGKSRVHGTILHEDSLLSRLRKNSQWKHLFFKAHKGMDDFSEILWPERFNEQHFMNKREEFAEDGDLAGYATEHLNDPQDDFQSFLKKSDFIPMEDEDHRSPRTIGIAADFAVSKKDNANRTSFTVGGLNLDQNLCVLHQSVGRWDSAEWIDEMFILNERWKPTFFWVEDGVIWKTVYPTIQAEMRRRDTFIMFIPVNPVRDKATRGRSLQTRMRRGKCRFNKDTEWYQEYEEELLKFTGYSEAKLDDQFDSTALLSAGFDNVLDREEDDFLEDDEDDFEHSQADRNVGRSTVTGY